MKSTSRSRVASMAFLLGLGCAPQAQPQARPSSSSGGPGPAAATGSAGASSASASTSAENVAQPPASDGQAPRPPFPEVSTDPTIPRVTASEAKRLSRCGPDGRLQIEGYVVEVFSCFCTKLEGGTVCAQPCVDFASIRERPDAPKEDGVGLDLPRPSRELFEDNGRYVVEGRCSLLVGPTPKLLKMDVTARTRMP